MQVLLMLVGTDIVIGTLCGFVFKNLNSKVGLKGLIKHTVVILLVLLFKYVSDLYVLDQYYNLFIVFYLIQYVLSILENAYCLGVPIPKFLMFRLKDYQEKEGLQKWEKQKEK